jgi:Skp family chaperone for outer membrane proteins
MEEKVIQPESVTPAEQPVAETTIPQAPNLDSVKAEYESKISALEAKIAEEGEKFQGIKTKLDDVYKKADDKRKKSLEDQGQWKDLWEEANKTAQEKDLQINTLNEELKNLKSSNETANIKTSALSAISNSGAVNAEQMLSLLQDKLKKNDNGDVVVLNGGVEQDLGTYIGNLKNPGSGWEHHFKPSSAAGMGAKPTPTSNVSPGMTNPWKEGSINLTRQMILESTEPDLAAVLKKEAGAST